MLSEPIKSDDMVVCDNLVKIYKTDEIEVVALQGLDLNVKRGELMAVVGNSGSGKSTLLNILGGLDRPSAGSVLVDGKDLLKFSDKDFITYKRDTVGFVWQNNARNLIPYLTARQNVEMPMILSGADKRRQRADELLDMMGLSARKNSVLHQMSGGEQQRVAIAIALANNPKLLLADEPTGAVDTKTANMILDIFKDMQKNLDITTIIVTHDVELSKKIDRVVAIRDGRTSSELIRPRSYKDELENLADLRDSGTVEIETEEEKEAIELAVLDRSGRLQIPSEFLEALEIKGNSKVRVTCEDDKICIYKYKLDS